MDAVITRPKSSDRTSQTRIAAHRGGAGLWPENSMTAFRHTTSLDVDQVEFDVHLTRDKQVVVHHDPTIDRMTNGSGPIAEYTRADLQSFTINGTEGDTIPCLSDVLSVFQPTGLKLRLELKWDIRMRPYPGLEERVLDSVAEFGLLDRTILTSFLLPVLEVVHRKRPGLPLIWLVNRIVFSHLGGIEPVLDIAGMRGHSEIGLHAGDITQAVIGAGLSTGTRIGAYGTHDRPTIQRMIDLSVSVFTTDRPDLAVAVRDGDHPSH